MIKATTCCRAEDRDTRDGQSWSDGVRCPECGQICDWVSTPPGFPHMTVVDKDHVEVLVDGDWEVFNRHDQMSGMPMSGWADFGPVGGDHRMIRQIAEDVQEAFAQI